jgi:hypothetical protein
LKAPSKRHAIADSLENTMTTVHSSITVASLEIVVRIVIASQLVGFKSTTASPHTCHAHSTLPIFSMQSTPLVDRRALNWEMRQDRVLLPWRQY